MKLSVLVILNLILAGCVMDSPAVHRDDSARVRTMGEERAQKDLACSSAKAGRPVRSVRMTEGSEPLFVEYRSWVEGCGKHVTYVIACYDDDPKSCVFADTLGTYPE